MTDREVQQKLEVVKAEMARELMIEFTEEEARKDLEDRMREVGEE